MPPLRAERLRLPRRRTLRGALRPHLRQHDGQPGRDDSRRERRSPLQQRLRLRILERAADAAGHHARALRLDHLPLPGNARHERGAVLRDALQQGAAPSRGGAARQRRHAGQLHRAGRRRPLLHLPPRHSAPLHALRRAVPDLPVPAGGMHRPGAPDDHGGRTHLAPRHRRRPRARLLPALCGADCLCAVQLLVVG